MTCDDVFEILTRGPFPSGEPHDEPVERHLAACHECRRMAEALRPAVSLFHESLAAEESQSLPGYLGNLACESGGRVPLLVESPRTAKRRRNRRWPSLKAGDRGAVLMRLGGALALVVVAIITAGLAGLMQPSPHPPAEPNLNMSLAHSPTPAGLELLRSLGLPRVCQERSLAAASVACCTECHAAQRTAVSTHSIALLAQACGGCHRE